MKRNRRSGNFIVSPKELNVLKRVKRGIEGLATFVGIEKNNGALKKKQIGIDKESVKNNQIGDSPVAKEKPSQKLALSKGTGKAETGDRSKDYLVGIDLGTSRSVLVTEDGEKLVVESVVGWPKDIIAVKVLGESIVFGSDVVKNRESLEVHWPLADGVIKEGKGRDQEAAEELIQHMLDQANVPKGRSVCGVVGVPAKASMQSKNLLMEIAGKCMDHVMLISEPFAVAYSEKKLSNAIVVDIGAGTADLCAMHGRIPDDKNQLTLTKAGNYADRILYEALRAKYPDASITTYLVKKFKEKYGTVVSQREKVAVQLRVDGINQTHDITEEMIYACGSIVPDIVEGIKHLIVGFDPEFEEEVLQNIILAGGMSQVRGLDVVIEQALKELGSAKVTPIKNAIYAGAEGALKLGMDIPVKFWNTIGDFGVAVR